MFPLQTPGGMEILVILLVVGGGGLYLAYRVLKWLKVNVETASGVREDS